MGRLDFLRGERVYFDTAPIIYSVEKHDEYWFLLLPLWQFLKSVIFNFSPIYRAFRVSRYLAALIYGAVCLQIKTKRAF